MASKRRDGDGAMARRRCVDAKRRRFLAERRAEATPTIVDAESTTMNEMSWYSDGEARARRRLRGDRRGHDALTDGDGVLAAGDGVRRGDVDGFAHDGLRQHALGDRGRLFDDRHDARIGDDLLPQRLDASEELIGIESRARLRDGRSSTPSSPPPGASPRASSIPRSRAQPWTSTPISLV